MRISLRKLFKYCIEKIWSPFFLTILFLVLTFGFFYRYAINKALSTFTSQMQKREELAVSSGAKSIQIFLKFAENSLLLLSRESAIVEYNEETQKFIENFASDWQGTPVLGVSIFDKDGELVSIASNTEGPGEIGKSFSLTDSEPFVWAKTAAEGESHLGKPTISKAKVANPQYIFPYVTPIYRNGAFDGMLAIAISLPKLTATYFDPLNIAPNSRVYLIHPDGTILSSTTDHVELVGVNYFEYLQNRPYPGSDEALRELTQAVNDTKMGKLDLILFSTIEKKPVRFLIAYSPVFFSDKHWTLGIAVPIKSVYSDFDSLRGTSIMLFSTVTLFTLTLAFVGIVLARSRQRKAYLMGLEEGKKSKK